MVITLPDTPTLEDLYIDLAVIREMIPAIFETGEDQYDTLALRSAIATACTMVVAACEATNPGLPTAIETEALNDARRASSSWILGPKSRQRLPWWRR